MTVFYKESTNNCLVSGTDSSFMQTVKSILKDSIYITICFILNLALNDRAGISSMQGEGVDKLK